VRNDTLDTISNVLTAEGLSIVDIRSKTGLAYNTVKNGLLALNAEVVPDSYPKLWKHAKGAARVRSKPESAPLIEGERYARIGLNVADNWPERWGEARRPFSAGIAKLDITPDADPKELAEQFARGAKSLASIAAALQDVSDKPDWFELVGGQIEQTQVS